MIQRWFDGRLRSEGSHCFAGQRSEGFFFFKYCGERL
jgi:hypothetical protein